MKYILILLLLCSCKNYIFIAGNQNLAHKCKYKTCPYKGLIKNQWKDSVANYTKTSYGDTAYSIDIVHLLNPNWGYEKICRALLIK